MLIGLRANNETFAAEEIWRTRHIRGTYSYAVFNAGLLLVITVAFSHALMQTPENAYGDRASREMACPSSWITIS